MLSESKNVQTKGQAHDPDTAPVDALCNPFDDNQFPIVPIAAPDDAPIAAETVPTQSLRLTLNESVATDAAREGSETSVREPTPVDLPEQADTQSSNIAQMREAFVEMMQPEHITQSDTQTQAPFFRPQAASESTVSPSRGERSPSISNDGLQRPDPRLVLSHTTAARLEQAKAKKRTRAKTKSKGDEDVIECQCGCTEEEGQMVRAFHMSVRNAC